MNELPDPTCADCKAFYMEGKNELGEIRGLCRLRSELGELPAEMPYCHLFRVRDSRVGHVAAVVQKKAVGTRRTRVRDQSISTEVRYRPTLKEPVTGDTSGEITMDRDGFKQVLRELLEEETMYGYPEMGVRWRDGTLILKPGSPDNQPKEVPIDTLFHKIIMVRERLRVLEAKINSNDKLDEKDKLELQGYISKCYGTLTTFNILFDDKADHFRSK
ncbi:MAG: hypothetical protein GY847_38695 [Proteobacteria bacterium]|nr:hypothetical protein [Pseudomonadota bacterium]